MRAFLMLFGLLLSVVAAACGSGSAVVQATRPDNVPDETVSLEVFLARYWGDRWAQVRPNVRASGCEWEAPVRKSALIPWGEVASKLEPDFTTLSASEIDAHCQEARRWGGHAVRLEDLDLVEEGINPSRKPLAEKHWARIHEIIAPYDEDLAALGKASAEQFVRFTTQLWREGKFWKAPFAPVTPPNPDGGRLLMMRAYSAGNWHVSFALHLGDDPILDDIWTLVGDVAHERAGAVRSYIESI
jgi:hypothetical protein